MVINANRKIIVTLLIIALIGLFLPWFFFDSEVDYNNGLMRVSFKPLFFLSFLGSLILSILNKRSKTIEIMNLMLFIMLVVSCIYLFFTWHVLNITGKISIRISIATANYGFYITLFSSVIASILQYLELAKSKKHTK